MSDGVGVLEEAHVWLVRPTIQERVSTAVGSVLLLVVYVGMAATLPPGIGKLPALVLALLAGVFFGSIRRRGVRLSGDDIEIRALLIAERVPIGAITRLHLPPLASGIGIELGDTTVVFTDASRGKASHVGDKVQAAHDLAQSLGVPVIAYGDGASFIRGVPNRRSLRLTLSGSMGVLRAPSTWGTTLACGLLLVPFAVG